jgi:hypothetical protein
MDLPRMLGESGTVVLLPSHGVFPEEFVVPRQRALKGLTQSQESENGLLQRPPAGRLNADIPEMWEREYPGFQGGLSQGQCDLENGKGEKKRHTSEQSCSELSH